ncbi:NAD(P)-dependent dehydrogenase, short-chain alcohol dehydrogenase family [Actinopolymorpha cephalotaxi]|uniref:NAD(P)-dependent dehydrogenase (Short-subunit alcohol dehydrogenase family) n=1 Tax=Actinopolymorpha cephalotaxi TaxID=504797 RepID=A0A1I2XF98_9ACTN|nr:glucose 1-dehydrogenase [Actinopolymorpha cephalotaxi]NYH86227.1 NAD(P)-dependent dehydrogenase (short-subunit alcohol dehydrogenase family) [Actinopolymorpha cephalotaxi]SFH12105.1 NAD(P)-dependent dehydrogenase, short-chain alcohol dehydrogenase family [Actinopolymorpha cephalotaxi]
MTERTLDRQVAIVTGASRGIGAVTARVLAQEGATVVCAARDEAALSEVTEEIAANGGDALAVPTDVGDPESVARLVARTVEAYGRLDVAVNNAMGGGHPPTRLADVAVEDYDSALRVGLRGVFLSMKYEIPAMLGSGGGAIVNMTSTAGVHPIGGLAGYVSAKSGVIGLTRSAALDYAEAGVRVNALAPGPTATRRLRTPTPDVARRITDSVPMRRVGTAEEVAAAVVWLCSPAAAFVTGTVLPVDGGMLAGAAPFSRPGPARVPGA